jgi:hypothetical protein
MSSFFDIDYVSTYSVEDYIATLKDHEIQSLYKSWFDCIPSFVRNVNKGYKTNIDVPEIKIKEDNIPNAEAIYGQITISTGMLDLIRTLSFANFNYFKRSIDIENNLCDWLILTNSFRWLIYHELFHIVHNHNDIIAKHPNKKLASQVCEMDADLCAIAMVYRHTEKELYEQLNLNKEQISCIVFYSVYWFLRTVQALGQEGSHPPIEERIHFILYKISTLLEPSYGEADLGLDREDNLNSLKAMFALVREIEGLITSPNGIPNIRGNAVDSLICVARNQMKDTSFMKEWNKIFRESRLP